MRDSLIILNCVQGSAEWNRARLGIPTASRFSEIVTPKGALSASREKYRNELLAEWALGYSPTEFHGNYWTDRGSRLEAEAIAYYQMMRGTTPQRVGFVYRDESRMVGCSPDWMFPPDGIGEVKCPKASTHIGYLLDGELPAQYRPQVQGQLWVTGAAWCDYVSYYRDEELEGELPEVLVRVEPDADYQAALDKAIPAFIAELLEGREELIKRGVVSREVAEALG